MTEPQPLTVRSYQGPADAERIAETLTACRAEAEKDQPPVSAEAVRSFFEGSAADSDPRSDVHLFFRGETLVAYERTRRETWASGARVYHVAPLIRPDRRDPRTLAGVVHGMRQYHAEFARRDDEGAVPFLSAVPDPSDTQMIEALLAAGFEPCHAFLRMTRRLQQDVAQRDLPPDLEVRPLLEEHHRSIYEFDREIMKDSWGCEAPTETHFQWWGEEAFLNPELWRVAWHGDEIVGTAAGVVGGTWNPSLGGERGEIRFVRVAPGWRRRGIASALILQCLAALRQRGIREVVLGVDGANETTAAALYRTLGFEVSSRMVAYRYDLPA